MREPRNKVLTVIVKGLTEGPPWRVELQEHFKQKSDIINFLFYKLTLDALKIIEGYEMRKRNHLREYFWNPRGEQCACKRVKVVRNISKMELTGFYQWVRNGQERKLEWYQQFWPEQLRK